jgi:hypothetical protein
MPEQDFELYLSLLSRFLRLKSAQRGEIADELRDHLEARLEELAARGLSRDEAIRAALDEFGDAAELANHFTQVAHIRKRRLIMRVTFGTITALAASLLVATAFWPETRQAAAPQRSFAQEPSAGNQPTRQTATAVNITDDGKAIAEAKLSKILATIPDELSNVDFTQAIEKLGELLDIDILIDQVAIDGAEIATNTIVNLNIKRTKLTGRMLLDLILEPLNLSYTIRDGLIMVTTAQHANQIQVYNIRDLLPKNPEAVGAGGSAPGMSMSGMMGGGSPAMTGGRGMMRSMAGMPMGMGGTPATDSAGGLGGGGGLSPIRETDSLAELIATTIDPDSWDNGASPGGSLGSIIQYHELLVVKNSQTVHGKIRALLEMMRTSANPRGATAPAGAAFPDRK